MADDHKPKSTSVDAAAAAATKYAGDPRLEERLKARAYGDALDKLQMREGMNDIAGILMLASAIVFYGFGEVVFSWQAGTTVMPGLELNGIHFGGIVAVANSLIFIFAVFKYIADGRKPGQNRWTSVMVGTAALAFFAIYTAQTTAADEVRELVGKRDALAAEIVRLDGEIKAAVIPPRAPALLALERAQDEAVGSRLNTVTPEEAKKLCADVEDFEARMTCRQKILRASVDCTQDISPVVRDAACDPIKFAQIKLASIDADEKAQAQRTADKKKAEQMLAFTPEASNFFIRQVASWTKWEIPDAQSRIYVLIGLLCLLVPAIIFAKVFVRRPEPLQPGGTV